MKKKKEFEYALKFLRLELKEARRYLRIYENSAKMFPREYKRLVTCWQARVIELTRAIKILSR